MQRQLLQVSEKIPDDIMLTLLKSFAQILIREPEPVQKTPFIRAFAKIRDDNIETQFSAIVEEDEDQLKDYESGNSEGENDCTFNYKVTTTTEEIAYSVGENDQNQVDVSQSAPIENGAENESSNEDPSSLLNGTETSGNEENIDEGIEVEMPKLLPADESSAEVESEAEISVSQEQTIANQQNLNNEDYIDSCDFENVETQNYESIDDRMEVVDILLIEEEPIPIEPPKVSLDDIQREIQEMQMFLLRKGVVPGKKNKSDDKESNGNVNDVDSRNVEDAYKVDVCIKLKNRNGDSQKHNSHKKHHHSKYNRSENYKEEITKAGPIFDPSIPNTELDFMKVKSERTHKKQQKVQALDCQWQNLCENQKKLYK